MDPLQTQNNESGADKSSVSSIIGILVIVIILILGAFYVWSKNGDEKLNNTASVNSTETAVTAEVTSTSSVESDVDSVNLDNLDIDINSL
ncbi:MAG: hypothetical protein Q7R78_00585 [bacterium]|nr:hypothetical protein [bacterium]